MLFTSSFLIAVVVSIAQAQTPEGFTPVVSTKLDVVFNSTAVRTSGQLLTKAGTASAPQIAAVGEAINQEDTYMFVMVDLDVPPANGTTTRRTLLHALTTDFKVTQQSFSNSTSGSLLASSEEGPATYRGPSPPATDTIPHRYVQLLFQQPETLAVQATDFAETSSRIGFDINAFMQEQGLSAPLAANFFTVDGKAEANGTATTAGGSPTRTPEMFTGAAKKVDISFGWAGLLGGLAIIM
ncbi:phosphatidylethanolamine-binding protein [Massariosphaeria phaeospora]|uniref:Phosphatidylethanolamine-binding protein n=1 Tax=Massariosphaeria phaeospora TaxID=100035 RepID=A0A7C8I7G7_9PLEO|nr:phosphatidylethanolamine-binding protein [Massariosphaeria phaeospora]